MQWEELLERNRTALVVEGVQLEHLAEDGVPKEWLTFTVPQRQLSRGGIGCDEYEAVKGRAVLGAAS